MSYLLDSNTIIYASKSDGSAIRDWINKHHTEVYVAEISLAEVRNWPKLAKTEIRQQALLIEALLDSFTVLKLDPVGVVISDLLRTKVNLKNADAIIAATALRYDLYFI
jgi:predicted nucleic acid-binding protein